MTLEMTHIGDNAVKNVSQIVTASHVQFSCCCQTFCDNYQENFATNPSDEGGLWIQVLILVPLSILPGKINKINELNLILIVF